MDQARKKILIPFIVLTLIITSGVFSFGEPRIIHSDWAKEDIEEALEMKLIFESEKADYRQNIRRDDFCALAARLYANILQSDINELAKNLNFDITQPAFSDTKENKERKEDEAITFLYYLGVISGRGDGKFAPGANIKREEAARILHGMCQTLHSDSEGKDISFDDSDQISPWALQSIKFVYGTKIMQGMGDNRFSPKGMYTIEQAIATFIRVKNHVNSEMARKGTQPVLTKLPNAPAAPPAPQPPTPEPPAPTPAPKPDVPEGVKITNTVKDFAKEKQEIFNMVNEERTKAGLPTLEYMSELDDYTYLRSAEIISKYNHRRPNGDMFYEGISIPFSYSAENFARGQRSTKEVMTEWMDSPGHKSNILNERVTHISVGIVKAEGSEHVWYWVQIFLKKL